MILMATYRRTDLNDTTVKRGEPIGNPAVLINTAPSNLVELLLLKPVVLVSADVVRDPRHLIVCSLEHGGFGSTWVELTPHPGERLTGRQLALAALKAKRLPRVDHYDPVAHYFSYAQANTLRARYAT